MDNLKGKKHPIKSPGTVQIVSFAPCSDITKVVTPDIKKPSESTLIMLDLSGGKKRLGGSALAQVYEQLGDETPDVHSPKLLKNGFEAVQKLIKEDLILSGHDVSEGGLIISLLEMAFAGNCGLDIDITKLGDDVLAALFSEELSLVFEVPDEKLKDAEKILKEFSFKLDKNAFVLGKATKEQTIHVTRVAGILPANRGRDALDMSHESRVTSDVLVADMKHLRDLWQETSFELDKLQANPDCVEAERKVNFDRKGLNFNLTFEPSPTPRDKMNSKNKPKIAILREEGTNGAREMAGAFYSAGFETWDVTMADIAEERISLKDFRGIAFCGGFSFADILDAGKGWAGVIQFNEKIRKEFDAFIERKDTFSLGVCNGCQVMALLGWIPWRGIELSHQPRFVKNESGIFESRFVTVKIEPSPSIFLQGMEGSKLGIWVAHGEGRCLWPDEKIFEQVINNEPGLAPIRYVDDEGNQTEAYPFNPNGSKLGITALSSRDGRHMVLMPHPERLFNLWQWPYLPPNWKNLKASPWLKLFQNARVWCEKNPT